MAILSLVSWLCILPLGRVLDSAVHWPDLGLCRLLWLSPPWLQLNRVKSFRKHGEADNVPPDSTQNRILSVFSLRDVTVITTSFAILHLL